MSQFIEITDVQWQKLKELIHFRLDIQKYPMNDQKAWLYSYINEHSIAQLKEFYQENLHSQMLKQLIEHLGINQDHLLEGKRDLISKFGFEIDEDLGEYVKWAGETVDKCWLKDKNPLNTQEELISYDYDNKVQFLDVDRRIGKCNWKEIRFIYDKEKSPILQIHTYNGFSANITQFEYAMFNFGIPGLDPNDSVDTYYHHTIPTFTSIEFYGNFKMMVPITFLKK